MDIKENTVGRWRHLLTVAALPLLLALSAPAIATDQYTPFELDADATDNHPGSPSDDWNTVKEKADGGNAEVFTGIIRDASPRTIFGGGKKDIQDVGDWTWTDNSVPDKNELTHAYAAAYTESDGTSTDLLLYFGADRIANSGSAFMGFWFFKDPLVSVNSNGTFSGHHIIGDTLILMNFPQASGAKPQMAVATWNPNLCGAGSKVVSNPTPADVGKCVGKNLLLARLDVGDPDSNLTCSGSGNLACGLTNNGDVNVPNILMASPDNAVSWHDDYTPKSGTPGVFPFETFFEGGINLTKILNAAGQTPTDGCFSSFMAESRASESFDAQLKDFVFGKFELCKIEITKFCTEGSLSGDAEFPFTFNFNGEVHNSGQGSLYNAEIWDDNGTPGDDSDDFQVGSTIPVLLKDATVPYSDSFNSAGNTPVNGITVKAAPSSGLGVEKTVIATASDECPTVPTNPKIEITKSCESKIELVGEGEDARMVVRVDFQGQVCNRTGMGIEGFEDPIALKDIKIFDKVGAGSYVDVTSNLDVKLVEPLAAADCQDYKGHYYPAAGSGSPSSFTFSDVTKVTANAVVAAYGNAEDESDTATCPLCPSCPTCPTAPTP